MNFGNDEGRMGHQLRHQEVLGNCQLTQCSCGRGALRVKDKVILLSSNDIQEIGQLFSRHGAENIPTRASLIDKLNGMTGNPGWKGFSIPQ